MEITIKQIDELLRKYIPISYEFSEIKEKDLIKKEKAFNKRISNIKKIENPEKKSYEPHCVFDLLILSENSNIDNKWYKQFLNNIDEIVARLKKNINVSLHDKLKNSVKQIILSLKEEIDNQNQYLDFYGEILGLDFFITQDDKFKLIEIERKLPNRKSVDFVFQHEDDDTPLYIDFVSLHNIKPQLLKTRKEFINFFENRFNQKLEKKTKDLNTENNLLIIENKKVPFMIQPIIWGNIEDFLVHKDTIKFMDNKYANVSKMVSLFVQINENDEIFYSFTTLSNILDRIIEDKDITPPQQWL